MATDGSVPGVDNPPEVPTLDKFRATKSMAREVREKEKSMIADKELHRDVKGIESAAGLSLGDDTDIPEVPAGDAVPDGAVIGDDELGEEVRQYARRLRAWLGNLKIADNKKKLMLVGLATHGTISNAALRMGTNCATHYKWIREDPEYAAAAREATEMVADRLESEAVRRAVRGVSRPVYHKGEQIGVVRNYSDLLLIFMLKAMRPEKYREKYEVNERTVNATVNIDVDYQKLSTDELLELRRLLTKVSPEDETIQRIGSTDGPASESQGADEQG